MWCQNQNLSSSHTVEVLYLLNQLTNRRTAIFREAARFPDGVEEFQEILRTFWDIEVWPVEVVELLHLPLFPGRSVSEDEAPDEVVVSVLQVDVAHFQLDAIPVLAKHHSVTDLERPILPGLIHVIFPTVAEHHDSRAVVLKYHQPKVIDSLLQRS